MRIGIIVFLILGCSLTFAQAPKRPLLPLNTWSLPQYHAVDPASVLQLPDGMNYERVSSVVFTPEKHLLVLHRGPQPLLEFDAAGNFIRAFGDATDFPFAHGLSVDKEGNLWLTDIRTHIVRKLDRDGNELFTLGTLGEAGEWDEANNSRRFNQPNEVAIDSGGNIYVAQGHTAGEPKVLKFDPEGKFIMQWGGRGSEPGKFEVAHSIKIDQQDRLYVADRENMRVQVFSSKGELLDVWQLSAMACAIYLHDDGFAYITTGFDGEFAKLTMTGELLGSMGSPGKAAGQFGEAHFLAVDEAQDVYVADVVNKRVQIYRKGL